MTDLRPDARRRHMRDTDVSMEPVHGYDGASVDDVDPETVEELDGLDAGSADGGSATASAPPAAPAPPAPAAPASGGRRQRPLAVPRRMPAGHAIGVIVGALVLAILFNSHAMVHAGEGMPAGTTRDLVLDVGRPVDSFAHAVYLDRPRKWLDSLFGHQPAPTGPSDLSRLPAQADNRPLGSGSRAHPSAPGPKPSAAATVAPPPAVKPLRVPTKAAPLKLLIAGDSMTEFLGPDLINQSSPAGKVTGNTITKYGTGLVRPDFFDWSIFAQQLVNQQNPEAVVVMIGGNDGQGITLANGTVLPDGSEGWAKEYRRRVEVVMRVFSGDGKRRVYWIPMPVPRSQKLAIDYHLMDLAVADAAAVVPGVTDVNVTARLSNHGQYADYLPGANGQPILARTRDGIHLSTDGANLAASLVLAAMNKDWHLT
jgi:uncharacterized protein